MLLDSNILIYAANETDPTEPVSLLARHPDACISSVTRLEVLGYHSLRNEEKAALEIMVEHLSIYSVTESVIDDAIYLRQQKSMSAGDAIIAATALQQKQVLYTRNTSDFKWIDGLSLVNPLDA